jgi:hypothetical protein
MKFSYWFKTEKKDHHISLLFISKSYDVTVNPKKYLGTETNHRIQDHAR